MGAYLGVAAPSGPSKHRPTTGWNRAAQKDIAALAAVLERSGAGGDDTKGDATGVSMTGGGALTTGGATVGGGTTAGGTTGVTGSATGFTGATTGATAAGAGTRAAPPKKDKVNWHDIELTKTAAKNDGDKTRTEDKRADADADAGGKTVTRTDADYCKGATTVGGDATGAGGGQTISAGGIAGVDPDQKERKSDVDTESDYEDYSICGYQDYDDDITEDDIPVRIKESLLTAEERARYQALLDQIFSEDCAINGRKIPFDIDDVYDVVHAVAPYFMSEPMLIEDLPYNIVVVADIHGQLYDLERIFSYFKKDGKPGWECRKFLFLGDYVDRGRQQLEVVMGLFIIKMLFPDNIFLLRGNHEFVATNASYGFAREIHARYSHEESAKNMYFGINSVFNFMSIAAIIGGNGFLCVHGGVSPTGFTRDNLLSLSKPVYESDDDPLVHDVTWADPLEGLEGNLYNADRHSSVLLGLDDVVTALEAVDCHMLIRGHSIVQEGYLNMMNVVICLFSATDSANCNHAAVMDIDATGGITPVQFQFNPKRQEFEAKAWANEGRVVEPDAKTVADSSTGALPKK